MATVIGALLLAFATIARNRLRAALTVLGILVGITAVVIVTALVEGTSDAIANKFDELASNFISVKPRPIQVSGARSQFAGRLTEADGRAVLSEAVSVTAAAPFLITNGQVVYADKNVTTTIIGTTLPYFQIRRFVVQKGENWTETDEISKTKVCVIGQTVATKLFGTEDPIGRTIRIERSPYVVLGLLKSRGANAYGSDEDDRVMMPASSYRVRVVHMPPGRTDFLHFSASSEQTVDRAVAQIRSILRQRHHVEDGRDDFEVHTQAEYRQATNAVANTIAMFGIGVAAVSLLVGGVGVMNIMLVSVAERTREIGIRMAIGARERDILVQFLVEAIVLTLLGGLLGIVCGSLGAIGIGHALDLNAAPSVNAIVVAVLTSIAIGTVFGFLPAWRAAKLDPIAALRAE